jgi:hypothetical protein
MKTTLALIAIPIVVVVGSLWGLGLIAFGNAKCTGVNIWAAIILTVIAVAVYTLLITSIDFLNDWIATRTASKGASKDLVDLTRAAINSQKLVQHTSADGSVTQGAGGLQFDEMPPRNYILDEVDIN